MLENSKQSNVIFKEEEEVKKQKIEDIDKEIVELKEQFKKVKGRETEQYSRIVGYYRPLSGWNKGAKEAYKSRVTFKPKYDTLGCDFLDCDNNCISCIEHSCEIEVKKEIILV